MQCAINDEIFNHVCACDTAKDLWEKLSLIYEETSEENLDSSIKDNLLCNSNDENEITLLCLMANKRIENRDTSDNNDDYASSGDDEEEEEETEYDIPDKVYDFLNKYSERKLVKLLLYYIRCQEGYTFKIKDFEEKEF